MLGERAADRIRPGDARRRSVRRTTASRCEASPAKPTTAASPCATSSIDSRVAARWSASPRCPATGRRLSATLCSARGSVIQGSVSLGGATSRAHAPAQRLAAGPRSRPGRPGPRWLRAGNDGAREPQHHQRRLRRAEALAHAPGEIIRRAVAAAERSPFPLPGLTRRSWARSPAATSSASSWRASSTSTAATCSPTTRRAASTSLRRASVRQQLAGPEVRAAAPSCWSPRTWTS